MSFGQSVWDILSLFVIFSAYRDTKDAKHLNDAINVPAVYKRQNPTNLTDSLNSVKKIILYIRFYSAVDPSFSNMHRSYTVWLWGNIWLYIFISTGRWFIHRPECYSAVPAVWQAVRGVKKPNLDDLIGGNFMRSMHACLYRFWCVDNTWYCRDLMQLFLYTSTHNSHGGHCNYIQKYESDA